MLKWVLLHDIKKKEKNDTGMHACKSIERHRMTKMRIKWAKEIKWKIGIFFFYEIVGRYVCECVSVHASFYHNIYRGQKKKWRSP